MSLEKSGRGLKVLGNLGDMLDAFIAAGESLRKVECMR